MTQTQNISFLVSDKRKFEEIFKLHYSELCSFAYNFTNDLEDAEETVQDVFYKLWSNKENLEIKTSIRAYLFSSVKNSCLNKKKHIEIREQYKEHNEKELQNNNTNVEDFFEASELEEKIRTAIDKLPLQRKKVFILSRYEGLKYKEIAEKLDISVKTVENQISSALKFLKSELAEYLTVLLLIFLKL
ncbi:MAG: RNA polymerase sigma-70 factor [Bacteroidales bacterium]|nr:RNA polymerase sigma-70 factor [Bacteroidales bacterium]